MPESRTAARTSGTRPPCWNWRADRLTLIEKSGSPSLTCHSRPWRQASSTTHRPIGDDLARLLGQGDEVARHEHPPAGRMPADERLDAHDRPGGELHDGLVLEPQLVPTDRADDERLELGALLDPLAHVRLEQLVAALAGALGPVHREVRVAQEVVGPAFAARRDGDPDARPRERVRVADADRDADHVDQAIGDEPGVLGAGQVLDEDGELVAAEAGRRVARPEHLHDPLRDHLQQLVAAGMAEAVVHGLEVVEVEEQDGDRCAGAGAPGQGVLDPVREQAAVGQPGQAVMERLVAQFLHEAGVVEGHRGFVGERPGEAEPALVEGESAGRVELDRADRLAPGDERHHHHRAHVDRAQVRHLGGVAGVVGHADHELALVLEEPAGRRVVRQRVRLVDRLAPLARVVAVGEHAVVGHVPVADPALGGLRGEGEVLGHEVADPQGVHRPGQVAREVGEAAELAGRGLEPRAELPEQEQGQAEGDRHRHDPEPRGGHLGQLEDRGHDLAHQGDEHADDPGEPDEPADVAVVEVGQDRDDRQDRRHGEHGDEVRLEDRVRHDDHDDAHGQASHEPGACRRASGDARRRAATRRSRRTGRRRWRAGSDRTRRTWPRRAPRTRRRG